MTPTTALPTAHAVRIPALLQLVMSWRRTQTTGSSIGAVMERAPDTARPVSRTPRLESVVARTRMVLLLPAVIAVPRYT